MASRIPARASSSCRARTTCRSSAIRMRLLNEIERFIIEAPMLAPFDVVLSTIVHAHVDGADGRQDFLEHAVRECDWFRGKIVRNIGGQFIAAFDGPARAIRCATALAGAAGRYRVTFRAGLHTGECSVVGGLPAGAPLTIAAAIASHAPAGRSWSPAPSATSSGMPVFRSKIAACTGSAERGSGSCSACESAGNRKLESTEPPLPAS